MPRAKKKERSMDLYEHIASLNTVCLLYTSNIHNLDVYPHCHGGPD